MWPTFEWTHVPRDLVMPRSKSVLYIYLKIHNNQISKWQGTRRCQDLVKQGGVLFRRRNPKHCKLGLGGGLHQSVLAACRVPGSWRYKNNIFSYIRNCQWFIFKYNTFIDTMYIHSYKALCIHISYLEKK